MKRGKKICTTLKEIRLQVARANDIPYEPAKCNHKGNCQGTCPKCEEEVRYIERQLSIRRMLGKVAAVAGVAMGVSMAAQPIEAIAQNTITTPKDSTVISALKTTKVKSLLKAGEQGIVVRGRIVDGDGEPLIGATIVRKGTNQWEVSNIDGMFALEVPKGSLLKVSYIGYKDFSFIASERKQIVEVVLNEDENLPEGILVVSKSADDVYGHDN